MLPAEQVARLKGLMNRLRGRYAIGPILPNGEPEFGYRQFDQLPDGKPFPAIHGEAADEIEAVLATLSNVVASQGEEIRTEETVAWGYVSEATDRLLTIHPAYFGKPGELRGYKLAPLAYASTHDGFQHQGGGGG